MNRLTPELRLIKHYDHACTLPVEKKDKSLCSYIIYVIRKPFLINELNPRAFKYCRSQYEFKQEVQKQWNSHPFSIHPLSSFRIFWELNMVLVSLFALFFVPYITTYELFPHISPIKKWQRHLIVSLDCINFIDIIININTGCYDSRRRINFKLLIVVKHYLRGHFMLDLLSSLYPVYYVLRTGGFIDSDVSLLVVNLVFAALKLLRIFSFLKYLNNTCQVLNFQNYKCKLTLLAVSALLVIHWVTCLCITVSTLSIGLFYSATPLSQSWISRDGLWNTSRLAIYITGLMRTACIVSKAEYEANEHQTTEDQLVMSFMWVLTRIFITLLTSFLIQVTRSIISSQTKYKEMVLQLKQYMHHKQLSVYTQNRLINYYEFRFRKRFFRDEEILGMISGHLRQEIRRHKCEKLVENVPFFKDLPQFLLIRIASCLQLEIFLKNDVIIKAKTRGSSMYFIASGTVASYTETGKEICHLYDGQHCGEIGLVMPEMLRISTIVAIEPCELYRLDRADFMNIIQPFPELLANIEESAAEALHNITAIDDKHRLCNIHKLRNKPFIT